MESKIIFHILFFLNPNNFILISAKIQAPRLQDAADGREAAQERHLQGQHEEVRRERARQQRREGQQTLREGPRPEFPLSRVWR